MLCVKWPMCNKLSVDVGRCWKAKWHYRASVSTWSVQGLEWPQSRPMKWRLILTVFYFLYPDIKKEIESLSHPHYFLTTLFINFICIIQNKILKFLNRLSEVTFWQALPSMFTASWVYSYSKSIYTFGYYLEFTHSSVFTFLYFLCIFLSLIFFNIILMVHNSSNRFTDILIFLFPHSK